MLAVVGAILWLCERNWQKPTGGMGSLWLLGAGALLCLPLLRYLAPCALECWDCNATSTPQEHAVTKQSFEGQFLSSAPGLDLLKTVGGKVWGRFG